jgi:hypothetical protein
LSTSDPRPLRRSSPMAHSTAPSNPSDPAPRVPNAMAEYDYSNFYYSSSDDLFAIFGRTTTGGTGSAGRTATTCSTSRCHGAGTPRIDLEDQLTHEHRVAAQPRVLQLPRPVVSPRGDRRAKEALDHYGLGAAGSPILSGHDGPAPRRSSASSPRSSRSRPRWSSRPATAPTSASSRRCCAPATGPSWTRTSTPASWTA